jgi:virginiamycin B lyase
MGLAAFSHPRISRFRTRLLGACAIAVLAAGCSGGGGSSATPPANIAPSHSTMASVTFTMHWNTGTVTSSVRSPRYVPPTARSVSVSVNGGTPQYLNAPATTITIDAPIGTDTFVFQTYDDQNGQGNVLSRASVTQAIVSGAANTVNAVLNGVVASVTISLANAAPNAGVPSGPITVNVAARDADGNTIVGPGDYSVPIHLAVSDPTSSGTLSLSTNNLPNPATTATLTYNGGTLNSGLPGGPTATVVASGTGIAAVSAAFTPKPTIYTVATAGSGGFTLGNKPRYIAAGSDGNMWFTEQPGNAVARITPAGAVNEFTVPTPNAFDSAGIGPHIIGASDGNLWFTESGATANKIAKSTTTGTITEFSTLFAPPPADQPFGLVDRGDGNIWYVANGSSRVGFVSYNGSQAGETSVPTASSGPFGIATSPDGYLWYTEQNVDKLGRVRDLFSPQSEVGPLTAGTSPMDIVRGPDGNLWFTENGRGNIGRLSPTTMSVNGEFPVPTQQGAPWSITVGQDGALWFTEQGQPLSVVDKIGRITTGGTVIDFPAPASGLALQGIATAPDGSIWFCAPGASPATQGRIGKLVY